MTLDGKERVELDVSRVTPDGTVNVSPESPIVADVPLAGDHLSAFISLLIYAILKPPKKFLLISPDKLIAPPLF